MKIIFLLGIITGNILCYGQELGLGQITFLNTNDTTNQITKDLPFEVIIKTKTGDRQSALIIGYNQKEIITLIFNDNYYENMPFEAKLHLDELDQKYLIIQKDKQIIRKKKKIILDSISQIYSDFIASHYYKDTVIFETSEISKIIFERTKISKTAAFSAMSIYIVSSFACYIGFMGALIIETNQRLRTQCEIVAVSGLLGMGTVFFAGRPIVRDKYLNLKKWRVKY